MRKLTAPQIRTLSILDDTPNGLSPLVAVALHTATIRALHRRGLVYQSTDGRLRLTKWGRLKYNTLKRKEKSS